MQKSVAFVLALGDHLAYVPMDCLKDPILGSEDASSSSFGWAQPSSKIVGLFGLGRIIIIIIC